MKPVKFGSVAQRRIPSLLHLGSVPEASSQARRYVRDAITALSPATTPEVLHAAELGVSELVTNACLHARTAITVSVAVTGTDRVHIEVGDDSPALPREASSAAMTTTGRGLPLLSAYGSWGVGEPLDGRIGKTVWFEPSSADAIRRRTLPPPAGEQQ